MDQRRKPQTKTKIIVRQRVYYDQVATVREIAKRLPRGSLAKATHHGKDVVVAKGEGGRLHVLPDACPHQGASLSEGFLEDGYIICPKHYWRIDPETGVCLESSQCSGKVTLTSRARRNQTTI